MSDLLHHFRVKSRLTNLRLDVCSLKALNNEHNFLHLVLHTQQKRLKDSLVQLCLAKSRAVSAIWIHPDMFPLWNVSLFFLADNGCGSHWAAYLRSASLEKLHVDTTLMDKENNVKHDKMTVKYQLCLLKCWDFFFSSSPEFLTSLQESEITPFPRWFGLTFSNSKGRKDYACLFFFLS